MRVPQRKRVKKESSEASFHESFRSGAVASQQKEFEAQDLGNLVGYQLRRTHSAVFEAFSAIMAKRSIAPGHFSILTLIHLNPDRTQSWLAKACDLDRSTVVPSIQYL